VVPRAGLNGCGNSRPHRIRSPDCPTRSDSLYRLRYPGPPHDQDTGTFSGRRFADTIISK